MAALTTTRAGNWADTNAGTTPWTALTGSGTGGVPGIGDSVTITHAVTVNANTTVGLSTPTTLTDDVVVSGTGSLTIAPNMRLTVRGHLMLTNTVLTLGQGSIYEFDSSLSTGTPMCKIKMGPTASLQNSKVVAIGISSNHAKFRKATGSGNGQIQRAVTANSCWAQGRYQFVDFSDLGDTLHAFDHYAVEGNLNHTAFSEFYLEDCTFINCGCVSVSFCLGANDVVIRRNKMSQAISDIPLFLVTSAATTGQRILRDNYMPSTTFFGAGTGRPVWFSGSMKNWVIENNVVYRFASSALVEFSPATSIKSNLCVVRGYGSTNNSGLQGICSPGGTVEDIYFVGHGTTSELAAILTTVSDTPGTCTYKGAIMDSCIPNEDGDFAHYGAPFALVTNVFRECLSLPNSRGRASGSLNGHGNNFCNLEFYHNTLMTSDNTAPTGTGGMAFLVGSGYLAHAGMEAQMKDNLIWSRQVRAGAYGNLIAGILNNTYLTYSGTATAGTTTTLTDSTAAFQTAPSLGVGGSAGFVVITAQRGAGPPVGEVRFISSNTATVLTVLVAFSAAPDTGTDYAVNTKDIVTVANVHKNAMYNGGTGTVYDATGSNPRTVLGFDKLWLTSPTSLGTDTVNLGTGTSEITQGPQFVDSTRNFANFDRLYLGHSGAPTWDASPGPFAIGDYIGNADPSFYGGQTINYRCCVAHTKATANSEPGVGSNYPTYWEFATAGRIGDLTVGGGTVTDPALGLTNATYIQALFAWVRQGFAPRAAMLIGTATDGGTIGAIPGAGAIASATIAPISGVQATTVPVTITGAGTSFAAGTTVVVSGAGVSVSGLTAGSATSLTANFVITAGALTGSRTVTVTTGAEIVTMTFSVNASAGVASISVAPLSGTAGTSVPVTITGTNTHFATATSSITVSGSGVTASNVTVASATSITCNFVLAAGAAAGARLVTVTTGTETANDDFTVVAAASVSVTPTGGAAGATIPVTVTGTGTHFVGGTTTVAVTGTGVTVSGITVTSPTSLTCNFVITSAATLSTRTVTVATGTESATDTFQVTPAGSPSVAISPVSAGQNDAAPVTINGTNTSFVQGTTTVTISGTGVAVSGVTVASPTSLSAIFTVAGNAPTGLRTVTITTGAQVVTTQFSVNAPQQVISTLYGAKFVPGWGR